MSLLRPLLRLRFLDIVSIVGTSVTNGGGTCNVPGKLCTGIRLLPHPASYGITRRLMGSAAFTGSAVKTTNASNARRMPHLRDETHHYLRNHW